MQSGGSCSASPHKYLRGWPIPSQFLLLPATAVSVTTPQMSQCNAICNKNMKCNTAAPSDVFLYSGPSLALSTPGFDPSPAHVRFMVDSVAVWRGNLPVLWFRPVSALPPMTLRIHSSTPLHDLANESVVKQHAWNVCRLEQLCVRLPCQTINL